jgi:hypothetical protein
MTFCKDTRHRFDRFDETRVFCRKCGMTRSIYAMNPYSSPSRDTVPGVVPRVSDTITSSPIFTTTTITTQPERTD